MTARHIPTLNEIREMVDRGALDTVVVAFPDHLGRLVGKRVTASYFFENVTAHGWDACNYLLTVDVEMNPLPGFAMASWELGYGDFHVTADMSTFRLTPWLEKTAMVLGDLTWEDGNVVVQSPRAMLRKQIQRAADAGLKIMMGSELEFYMFLEPHQELVKRNFNVPRPSSDYIIDYHVLHTTRDEFVIREIRNRMTEARIPVESSKGEWGKGQQEINLLYADALEMADRHVIYKNGVKEIAWARDCSVTFMAKYDSQEAGSSCHIHTSAWDLDGRQNLFWDEQAHGPSALFRQFLGGMLKYGRDFFLFSASTVNSYKRYQAATFAPTRLVWSHDNRTTGMRALGHGNGFRVENRTPGADVNPYLAFAATIAAGLAGVEEGLDCGAPYKGDAYHDNTLPFTPRSLPIAADAFEQSAVARKAFGDQVVDHYVHLARLEQDAYDKAVTDWERRRYFDRI